MTKFKILVSEFPLVTQLDWALKYLSVRLPMLLPRFQKSVKNGISTFLRSPLHCEYQRMTTGYSPRCSCLAGNFDYLLTQWEPDLHRNNLLIILLLSRTAWSPGKRGGKSGDQPPKNVYDVHCDAGIDISRSLPYQI